MVSSKGERQPLTSVDCIYSIFFSDKDDVEGRSSIRFFDGSPLSAFVFVVIPESRKENLSENDVSDVIEHELNHIYQQACKGDIYDGITGYLNAASLLDSPDGISNCTGTIGYLVGSGEIESFGNEIARAVCDRFVDSDDPRGRMERTSAVRWLKRLKLCIEYIRILKRNGLVDDEKETYENVCTAVFGKILPLMRLEKIAINTFDRLGRTLTRAIGYGIRAAAKSGKAWMSAGNDEICVAELDSILDGCNYDDSMDFAGNLKKNVV